MGAVLFYLFGAGALLSGANVVLRRQAVPAALWLVVCFFFLAGEFLLLGAPFLAAVQIMVYVGAIMVLFLFVIMLLDLRGSQNLQGLTRRNLGLALAVVVTAVATAAVAGADAGVGAGDVAGVPPLSELVAVLFSTFLLPFEVTSVLLVAAIVGALTLGRSSEREEPDGGPDAPRRIRLTSGEPPTPSEPADAPAEPEPAEAAAR